LHLSHLKVLTPQVRRREVGTDQRTEKV